MSEIKLSKEEKHLIVSQLQSYCEQQLDFQLEQFDAEFFAEFVIKTFGPLFYNAGIEEAIKTHQSFSEQIQEYMDLKRIL
ncbi:Uncharacterized conserved protein, DUF2164 family [Kosakonia oryzendophytica]|uniref:Uncharacterized conserved protein, DUF2164 family n=1 Tax=Kosakonia oryzendophytica TaxID=1005665 RepID=A0A1C4CN57_9ENTR|nr:DUF2164 family protein [Kosakonia oryzendophytica]AMO47404.1 Hypothetical protein AKI40_0981 [Enterobacter sp. FY-07]TDT56984.1 uncharacterized protein (DUF2164 family) [Enterobacter sp. AG5470]WBT59129.1 DUF2164 family protein [Kosakonia oryzendophytica]SCC20481.1 Uncharacterized conserved protein, DUF2164 family [Kosakonia oryzendophytica]